MSFDILGKQTTKVIRTPMAGIRILVGKAVEVVLMAATLVPRYEATA